MIKRNRNKAINYSVPDGKEVVQKISNMKDLYGYVKFDIKQYQQLDELSDIEIIYQLERRLSLKGKIELVSDVAGNMLYLSSLNGGNINVTEEMTKEINSIAGDLKECLENPLKKKLLSGNFGGGEQRGDYSNVMSIASGIAPMNRYNLEKILYLDNVAHGKGKGKPVLPMADEIEAMEEKDYEEFNTLMSESLNKVLNEDYPEMYVSVDLKHNDNELIESFRGLLKKWRTELQVDEPEKEKNWEYVKNRVLEYNVVAILDLLNLSLACRLKISNRMIAIAVFPDGERDGFGISQTVMPFIEKSITNSSIQKYKREIQKEK